VTVADPLKIEVGVASYYSASNVAAIAREVESRGIERFWIAENYYWRSAVPLATVASQATSAIGIGLGVLNWFTRAGPLLAMEAATLDELSGGRLTLGIGAGRTPATDLHIDRRRVIPGLQAAVETCRQMLKPNVVGLDESDEGRVRSLSLGFEPIRPSIPTYLAGMGPKTLQLAGEIADGAFLDVLTGPEFVREALEFVSVGSTSPEDESRIFSLAPTCCSQLTRIEKWPDG
jgi:5,10-methylenetetrahydromethanopterin reductase